MDAWIGVVCAKLVVHGLEELRCVYYAESVGEDGTVVVCDSFGLVSRFLSTSADAEQLLKIVR